MSIPQIYPTLPRRVQQVLSRRDELFELLATEDRALAIALPAEAADTVQAFDSVLSKVTDSHRIFVAHKATDRIGSVGATKHCAGIDVASLAELRSALAYGYAPHEIIATGPKSTTFLTELCQHSGIVIVLDSLCELQRLLALPTSAGAQVLLRLSRSMLGEAGGGKVSRFGFDETQYTRAIEHIRGSALILRGVAFHLDTRSIREKVAMAQLAFDKLITLQRQGFRTATVLDIGGGFGADYGLSQADIDAFDGSIRAMLDTDKSVTWAWRSYGLVRTGGITGGVYNSVDMPTLDGGAARVQTILTSDYKGQPLGRAVSDMLCEVWIEPGNAVFASAGIVVASVIDVTQRDGIWFVTVNAHRNQVTFGDNESIADPLLIARHPSGPETECYVTGQLCMETDFMTFRIIRFPSRPQVGDAIAWTHTGAYRMHMSQSRSIGHPEMARYAIVNDKLQKDEP